MHEVLSQDLPCSSSDRNSQIIGLPTQSAKERPTNTGLMRLLYQYLDQGFCYSAA